MRLLLVAKVRPTIRASLSARDLDGGSTPEKSDEISAEFSVAMEIKRNEGVAGWGWPTGSGAARLGKWDARVS
jgi:hypothetical protein